LHTGHKPRAQPKVRAALLPFGNPMALSPRLAVG